MIKILHWKLKSAETDAEGEAASTENAPSEDAPSEGGGSEADKNRYSITLDANTLNIEFNVWYQNAYRAGNVQIDTLIREKVYDVFMTEADGFKPLVVPAYEYCSRDGLGTNTFDRKKVARVVVDNLGDIYIVCTYAIDDIEGYADAPMEYADVLMEYGTHPASYYLKRECAWFNDRWNLTAKKYALLRGVDDYKSISYLEAQVDVLTKIVLELARDKGIDGYSLLEEASKYSVLNIKPEEDVLKEFTEGKQEFRKLQEGYYGNLHG